MSHQSEFVEKVQTLCADIDEGDNYWASADLSACGRRLNVYAIGQDTDWFLFEYLLDLCKPDLKQQAEVIEKLEGLL